MAVNERWKNRDGEPQERTTWLRVAAFNGVGQACAEHLACGDAVFVEGREVAFRSGSIWEIMRQAGSSCLVSPGTGRISARLHG